MDNIDKFKDLKENLRATIDEEMYNLVPKFKEYVAVDHPEYSKHVMIEGIWYRNNYGCEKDRYYYYYLPVDIYFKKHYSLWRTTAIFYDDKYQWWFIYDKDHNKATEFSELDTDTQIATLEQMYKFLNL